MRLHRRSITTVLPGQAVETVEGAVHPVYNADATYDERLTASYAGSASTEQLEQILDSEAEEEFFAAVAGHRNATPEQIARAVAPRQFMAVEAALNNPNISEQTAAQIWAQATTGEQKALDTIAAEGLNPMSGHHRWLAERAADFKRTAERLLISRGLDI